MGARGGIDLGGTKIQAVVIDPEHVVLGQARRPTPIAGGPADVAAALAEAMRAACAEAGVDAATLDGVGVGSPGAVDERRKTVSGASNLPGWSGAYALGATLEEALGVRVSLGNDVQVATDAEAALGAGRDRRSLLGVFWGTGVGGGLVLGRKRWLGRGSAGEIGHVVVKRGGAECPCGRRGCMEAYAGRKAMEERARRLAAKGRKTVLFEIMEERGRDRLTSGIWARALKQHDELATELIDRAVAALGTGIASSVNLIDPEAVVIGGGLGVRLGQEYVDRIAEAMRPHLFVDDDPAIRVAELGDLGGAIGGALLVRAPRARASRPRKAVASAS